MGLMAAMASRMSSLRLTAAGGGSWEDDGGADDVDGAGSKVGNVHSDGVAILAGGAGS